MDTDINAIFKTEQTFNSQPQGGDDGDFISGPTTTPAEVKNDTPAPETTAKEEGDGAKPDATKEDVKPSSKLDRLKLSKPKDEEVKVEPKPEENKKPTKEDNIRILRQAKEELDKLKPEYEKYKTDLSVKDKELLTAKEELTKLKALGLNEQEREEYKKYKDLHAIEAVKNSDDFKNKIEAPIQAKVDWISTIAARAKMDDATKSALYNAVDIPDKLDRQKAIRELFKETDLDVDDFQTYTNEVIAASNELNESLYPKMDETLAKAQEIELAARDREKNQTQEATAKEQQEFQKEHEDLVEQLSKDHLRLLLEDTDLSLDGTSMAEAMKNAVPASDPKERAWQAIAGSTLPFVVSWAQKILNENHSLKQANGIRNKTAPSLGRDGLTKTPEQKNEISLEEAFGRR